VIRLVNITKDKEEREFVSYNQLPNKMWYIWLKYWISNIKYWIKMICVILLILAIKN
jgi:hypothetical protein